MIEIEKIKWRTPGVYAIENIANGKIYVGSSVCIKKRLSEHRSRLNSGTHHNLVVQSDWNIYGCDCFLFYGVEISTVVNGELKKIEQKWINFYNSTKSEIGYNILPFADKQFRYPKMCKNCKRHQKPLRHGRCHTCEVYFSRRGKERPYTIDGRVEKRIDENTPCLRCNRPLQIKGHTAKGLCKSCYRTMWGKKKGLQNLF